LPGITVGRGAVVGAGAVVTKDVEAFSIQAGVPAKCIGYRPNSRPLS
jgi:acetyltransferase-like isoleucine patch superfamily enzyme